MRAVHLLIVLASLVLADRTQGQTPYFKNVVSLGDSLLDDPYDTRSPVLAEYIAEGIGAPLTKLAVQGKTSATLISGGQHTTAAANFGPGDLAILWIGGNDFLFNLSPLATGNLNAIDILETNVDVILGTLRGAGLEVLVMNIPDFAIVPMILLTVPDFLPAFTTASQEWNDRLEVLAATHGAVLVDVFGYSQNVHYNPEEAALLGTTPIPAPAFGSDTTIPECRWCLFYDGIHPSSLTQALAANEAIKVYNDHYGQMGAPTLPLLGQSELLATVGIHEVGTWTTLAGGTFGQAGMVPTLEGRGALVGDSTLTIELTNGNPGALALLWFSTTSTPLNALGGTIYPYPVLQEMLVRTDGDGGFSASGTFPPGVPSGTQIWYQFLVQDTDPNAPFGATLTDAVRAATP